MAHGGRTATHPEFDSAITELHQSTARTIIFSTGCAYLLWHTITTASWPVELGGQVWAVTALVVLAGAGALWLLPRSLVGAMLGWLGGLAAAITLALVLLGQPLIGLLYALLPLMAVTVLGWPAGLVVELALTGLIWALVGTGMLPPALGVAAALGGAATWLLGWASSHTLTTVTRWSLFSFAEAQQHLAAIQEQRAQLARTLKDLDHAYYRLERANAALVAARTAAQEAERFRAEFVTNISHELRTPLNLIVGFSEVMMTAPQSYHDIQLPGVYRRDLNAIYRNAQHLRALVDDVLDLARLEAGKIALARQPVDLAALVAEAAETMRAYMAAKGLELQLQLPPDLPPLWLDRLRIRQVLLNLLVNAVRFTTQGRIGVEVVPQEGTVAVRVHDTGRGIAEHDLPTIFETFRSTEQPPAAAWHSGSGLGLPISKQFVELHGGQIGVESTLGRGTTFWFTLPCAATAERRLAGRPPWPPLVAGVSDQPIIVVAHDDPQVAPLLGRHLDGFRVVGVAEVAAGVTLAEELRAVALLIAAGKAAAPPSSVPLVRCPLPSSRQTASAMGVHAMLVKPVAHEQLLAAIDDLSHPVQRLLIADDDADMARLLQRLLAARLPAPECLIAHNGAEALALLRAMPVDLLLLDLAMPDLDGPGVLEQLALDARLAGTPVIVISGQVPNQDSLRLPGAIEIVRPEGFRLGELLQTLTPVLSALAAGWRQPEPRAAAHAATPTG